MIEECESLSIRFLLKRGGAEILCGIVQPIAYLYVAICQDDSVLSAPH
jgi:hypothetical protein